MCVFSIPDSLTHTVQLCIFDLSYSLSPPQKLIKPSINSHAHACLNMHEGCYISRDVALELKLKAKNLITKRHRNTRR